MTDRDALPTPMKILLVEGNDDKRFFEAFMRHLGETAVSVEIYGGKENLGNRLVNLSGRLNSFASASVGIVRDADDSAQSAFDSVVGSLRRVNLPTPDASAMPTERDGLRVSVLILPPGDNEGELEDVCLRAVAGSQDMECVEGYIGCLNNAGPPVAANRIAKARLHSYLAAGPVYATQEGEPARRRPALRLGEAAEAGVWDWTSPAFERLAEFLRNL